MGVLRYSLMSLCLGMAALAPASANDVTLSLDEAATCAGMSVTLDRLVAERGRFKNRIAHMEVDRSNVSSVDLYNDLVAASNVLVGLSNPLIDDFNEKCGATQMSRVTYSQVCSGTNGLTSFCQSFGVKGTGLVNGETNVMAVKAGFGDDAQLAGGHSYTTQDGNVPVETDLFPRLEVVHEEPAEAIPASETRRVQRFPRDGYR